MTELAHALVTADDETDRLGADRLEAELDIRGYGVISRNARLPQANRGLEYSSALRAQPTQDGAFRSGKNHALRRELRCHIATHADVTQELVGPALGNFQRHPLEAVFLVPRDGYDLETQLFETAFRAEARNLNRTNE